ncbi:MarR family transcriptional regulator [Mycolicibacterium sediminis]|uniref:Uncharacterized protein n=1 Tax=Mycolicibacterium sediminis TaxID=1286180 RepID=A0A7I7QLY5_9MYCO|nr:MarR family transcriptional regulator [Mycolicibacterium sediminis]BBY27311.1 hypothetical protein MSEDJ_14070 [Mycolicibacterium sediminis]
MNDLEVLQTVRLKGRVAIADVAAALGADPGATVDRLAADGLVVAGPTLRLTPDGRVRLATLLADERATVDTAAAESVYRDFTPVNADFKAALSEWQLARGSAQEDPARDAEVLAAVEDVHRRVTPVVAAAGDVLPRLRRYADRLAAALGRARSGDLTWISRPLVDSYHTVWFELHEELIGLAGRTRDGD